MKEFFIVAPDGETVLTRRSSRNLLWVSMVKVTGEPWGWHRWSETERGARVGLKGWEKLPTLEATYVGCCRPESYQKGDVVVFTFLGEECKGRVEGVVHDRFFIRNGHRIVAVPENAIVRKESK